MGGIAIQCNQRGFEELFELRGALWVLAVAALGSSPVRAQTLIRGPYLQLTEPGGVTVRWRTDLPKPSEHLPIGLGNFVRHELSSSPPNGSALSCERR
jgi:hypothetical protein